MMSPTVFRIKVICVGNFLVGKTSITVRFTENRFPQDYQPTLGVDFYSKEIELEIGGSIKMVIFDTAGQEKMRELRQRYYYGALGAIAVFDITRKDTMLDLVSWFKEVRKNCGDIPIIMAGNKIDLVDSRMVTDEEARDFAKSQNVQYLATSALENTGVKDMFSILGKLIVDRMKEEGLF